MSVDRAVAYARREYAAWGRLVTGSGALTRSERGVALLAAEGLSNRQIGERLFISQHTVARHLSRVFTKLGVRSRTELVTEATLHS
jgi:DNA-binding CsgD family transcriptional regulator